MKVWIVGKLLDANASAWEFQGVFDSQELAEAACVQDEFFIGPAEMNAQLPVEREGWDGAYYPRLEPRP